MTAEPMHRLFGITTVKVGTGHRVTSSTTAVLSLDALSALDAGCWSRAR
ncbi:hypothetical protein AB0J63_33145 [Streptosporangium canum]